MITETQWLTEAIPFFRSLEFFGAQAQMSDAELVQWLAHRHREEWRRPFDISDSLADLHLLRFDQDRVWWEDIEADVCEGNNVYQRVLLEWARISRGCFSPTNIEERWDSDEG